MFIVPECDINTQGTLWVNHSVNEHFILQSRQFPKKKSFFRSLGFIGQDDTREREECENVTLDVENCLYRILTKSFDQKRIYVIAIDNEFQKIINDWNSSCEEIIPMLQSLEKDKRDAGSLAVICRKVTELRERSGVKLNTISPNNIRDLQKEIPWLSRNFLFLSCVHVMTEFNCSFSIEGSSPSIRTALVTPRALLILPNKCSKTYPSNEPFAILPYHLIRVIFYKKTGRLGRCLSLEINCDSVQYSLAGINAEKDICGLIFALVEIGVRLYMRRVNGFTERFDSIIPRDVMLNDLTSNINNRMYLFATPEILTMPFESQFMLFDINNKTYSRDTVNMEASKLWSSTTNVSTTRSYSNTKTIKSSDLILHKQKSKYNNKRSFEKKCSHIYKPNTDIIYLENIFNIEELNARLLNMYLYYYFFLNPNDSVISEKIVCYLHDKSTKNNIVGSCYFTKTSLSFSAFPINNSPEAPYSFAPNHYGQNINESKKSDYYSVQTKYLKLNIERNFIFIIHYSEISEIHKNNINISQIFDWVEILSSSGTVTIKLKSNRDLVLSFSNNIEKNKLYDLLSKQVIKTNINKHTNVKNTKKKIQRPYLTPSISEKLRNIYLSFGSNTLVDDFTTLPDNFPLYKTELPSESDLNFSSNNNTSNLISTLPKPPNVPTPVTSTFKYSDANSPNISSHPAYDILFVPSLIADDEKKSNNSDKIQTSKNLHYFNSSVLKVFTNDNSSRPFSILKVPLLSIFPIQNNKIKKSSSSLFSSVSYLKSDPLIINTRLEQQDLKRIPLASNEFDNKLIPLNKPWEKYFYTYVDTSCSMIFYEHLRDLIFQNHGVPQYLRNNFYSLCMGLDFERSMEGVYTELCSTKLSSINEYTDAIDKDVRRSMPTHPAFVSDIGVKALSRLLNCYSWRNSDVGYAQSLNIIGAVLLLYFDEERAFTIISFIIEYLLPDHYTKTMFGAVVDQRVFKDLVKNFMPDLHEHMLKLNIDIHIINVSWFISIFQSTVSHKLGILFLDCFILDGPAFLFWVSLAILDFNKESLMREGVRDVDFLMVFRKFFIDMETSFEQFELYNLPNNCIISNEQKPLSIFQKLLHVAYTKYCPLVTRSMLCAETSKSQREVSNSISKSTLSFSSNSIFDNTKFTNEEIRIFIEITMYIKYISSNIHGLRNTKYNLFPDKNINSIEKIIECGFWKNHYSKHKKLATIKGLQHNFDENINFCKYEDEQSKCDHFISFNDFKQSTLIFGFNGNLLKEKNTEIAGASDLLPSLKTCIETELNQAILHDLNVDHQQPQNNSLLLISIFDRIYYYYLIKSVLCSIPQESSFEEQKTCLLENLKSNKDDTNVYSSGKLAKIGYSTCFLEISTVLRIFEILLKETAIAKLLFIFNIYDVDNDGHLNFIDLLELCLGLMELAGLSNDNGFDIVKKDIVVNKGFSCTSDQILKEIRSFFFTAAEIDINSEKYADDLIGNQILCKDSNYFPSPYTYMLCQLLYSGDKANVFFSPSNYSYSNIKSVNNSRFICINSESDIEKLASSSVAKLYRRRKNLKLSFENVKLIFVIHKLLNDYFDCTWIICEDCNVRFPGVHAKLVR